MDVKSNEIVHTVTIHRHQQKISQLHEHDAAEEMCLEMKKRGHEITLAVLDRGSSARLVILKYIPNCCIQVSSSIMKEPFQFNTNIKYCHKHNALYSFSVAFATSYLFTLYT